MQEDEEQQAHYRRVEELELAATLVERKEKRGTLQSRPDNPKLCSQCVRGTIIRRELEVKTWCRSIDRWVPNDIVECTSFNPPGGLSMEDMEKLALKIDTRPLPPMSEKAYL